MDDIGKGRCEVIDFRVSGAILILDLFTVSNVIGLDALLLAAITEPTTPVPSPSHNGAKEDQTSYLWLPTSSFRTTQKSTGNAQAVSQKGTWKGDSEGAGKDEKSEKDGL